MSAPTLRPARCPRVIAVGLCLVGAAASSCDRAPTPVDSREENNCPTAHFEEPFQRVDPCSAPAVALAVIERVFTYRPSDETDQRSAFRAAIPLMAAELVARGENAAPVLAPITSAQWQRWRESGVVVTATARLAADDHPTDTDRDLARVAGVALHTADGTESVQLTVYLRATRPSSSARWLISALEVRT
ncbi:hypothetical protein [Nocardia sp. NPDC056100]|uniref:hypothetical protein n=1 Tax=Nocardia sp. NPDC056100 TaxID=3345712 RepID=UPI0035DE9A1B